MHCWVHQTDLDALDDVALAQGIELVAAGDDERVEDLEGGVRGLPVSIRDLGRVETIPDEPLGLAKQLSRQCHHEVGPVTDLLLLGRGGHDNELGGRVGDLELVHNGSRVAGDEQLLQVVDHHLVHACDSKA